MTKNTVITPHFKIAKTFTEKLRGMIRDKEEAVLFRTRFGIHTFFMNGKIDILVMDKNVVIDIAKDVAPGRVFFWNPKYSTVIEVKSGLLDKSQTAIGDKLNI